MNRTHTLAAEAALPSTERAVQQSICEVTRDLCIQHLAPRLCAVVITGSVAREEASLRRSPSGWVVLGDAEFLLVLKSGSRVDKAQVDWLGGEIEAALRTQGIACQVVLSPVDPTFLSNMRPHIFGFELRHCGRVLWGQPDVLSLIPVFTPADISLEDAWRLLANRIIELLEEAARLKDSDPALSADAYYRTVKLYLDMGTSLLLFLGGYEPTYRQRAEQLKALAEDANLQTSIPFPLVPFTEKVALCTRAKLNGSDWCEADLAFLEQAVFDAHQLWQWELTRLLGTSQELADRDLMREWSLRQPLSRRLRGWLYVVRARGWVRSWKNWPRWARLVLRASPRYLVYAAGSELLFALPRLLKSGEAAVDIALLRSLLPCVPWDGVPGLETTGSHWRQLAAAVAWNYHEFLEKTRS